MATYINHVAYSWSMIQLKTTLAGDAGGESGLLIDATAVNWSVSRQVDNIYGLGGQPRGRGFGNVEYSASITLPYATQVTLRAKSENGTLMGLGDFDLIVSFTNDLSKSANTETITLSECFFTQGGMNAQQNDTSLTQEFDLHPYRIFNPTAQSSATWSFEMYSK